jgi:hypothetical protein
MTFPLLLAACVLLSTIAGWPLGKLLQGLVTSFQKGGQRPADAG